MHIHVCLCGHCSSFFSHLHSKSFLLYSRLNLRAAGICQFYIIIPFIILNISDYLWLFSTISLNLGN